MASLPTEFAPLGQTGTVSSQHPLLPISHLVQCDGLIFAVFPCLFGPEMITRDQFELQYNDSF